MARYLARRLVLALLTCIFISVVTFAIIQLPPGDYVSSYVAQMAASGSSLTQEEAAVLRRQYGLDEPMPVQYLRWVSLAIQGNFGRSMEWMPRRSCLGKVRRPDEIMSSTTVPTPE